MASNRPRDDIDRLVDWQLKQGRQRGDGPRSASAGGAVPPPVRGGDSVPVRLAPGYVSADGGRTWREVPDEPREHRPGLVRLYGELLAVAGRAIVQGIRAVWRMKR
ncbi:hypothetical protein [Nocardia sp. CA-290969]|uniref:hypothetical protein n=1 Tax=Nocardia sp. CA-290969 TaxID=3239986 RepID=UPI003D8E5EE1